MTELTPLSAGDLAAAIGPVTHAGKSVPVVGTQPDRDPPLPGVVVEYGEPWISNAEDYPHGVYQYAYTVRVIAGRGKASVQEARVVRLAQTVIARLQDSQVWRVGQIAAPFALVLRENVTYLAVDVNVTALATITEE